MGRDMVTTNAQNLGIQLLEPAVVTPEQDRLFRSATGKIQYMKRQNHMLLAPVLA
jgi:hypothetical protein